MKLWQPNRIDKNLRLNRQYLGLPSWPFVVREVVVFRYCLVLLLLVLHFSINLKKKKKSDSVKIDQLLKFSSPTSNLEKTGVRETQIQAIF